MADLLKLRTILNNSGVQRDNSALYQVVNDIISTLMTVSGDALQGPPGPQGPQGPPPTLVQSFLTKDSEPSLSNHRRLVAGANVTLDASVASQLIINAAGSSGGGGDVFGPASSVNNDVALFSGATGKLIKDSGILISSLQTKPILVTDLPSHATRHSNGGADPVTVTNLAGYPGGSTTFLRADGTFAAPPTGAIAAHAPTHNNGGSDPITSIDAAIIVSGTLLDARLSSNVALENISNNFTASPQTLTGLAPTLLFVESGSPPDEEGFKIVGDTQKLLFQTCIATGLGFIKQPLILDRLGNAIVEGTMTAAGLGTTPLNASNASSGTLPDARLSVNVLKFTGGYPGGTTNFLRADGTFNPPPAAGSPTNAQYWVSTADAGLSAERDIGALASGYVKSTVAAGVSTPSTVASIPVADGGTGVTTGLTVLNADNLTTGTVPAGRLTAANLPAHASRHNAGGADAMAIDAIAATGSLRTLGTTSTSAAAGNDPRFTDSRTPTLHASTHNAGGSDVLAIDAAAATGSFRTLGTSATSACAGNDSRLTNSRTPTAHATTHQPGGSDAMAVDAAAATGSLRTLGTSSTSAAAGNDARFTDARTPTAHATSHKSGGSDVIALDTLGATTDILTLNASLTAHGLMQKYPGGTANFLRADGTFAAPPTGGIPSAHASTHNAGGSDVLAIDAAPAVGSFRTLGTGANQAAPGNDTRFTAAPQLHATTHKSGGTDVIALDTLGAPTDILTLNASLTAHGLMQKYPGGTANFLRADGTFAAPPTGGIPSAHATTHNTGGSDPITALAGDVITTGTVADARLSSNVALKNINNNFSISQTIFGPDSTLFISNSNGFVNQRMWRFISVSGSGVLNIGAVTDANAFQSAPLILDRSGSITTGNILVNKTARPEVALQTGSDVAKARILSAIPGGRVDLSNNVFYDGTNWMKDDTTVAGTLLTLSVGTAAFFSVAAGANPATLVNRFDINTAGNIAISGALTVTGAINGSTLTISGALTVGSSIVAGGNIHTKNASFMYPGRADIAADGNIQGSWYLGSHASYGLYCNTGLYIVGSIWERNRGVAIGDWTAAWLPSYTSPAYNNEYSYAIVGKVIFLKFHGTTTLPAGITQIYLYLPAPYTTTAIHAIGGVMIFDGGGWENGFAYTSAGAGGTYIVIFRNRQLTFTAGQSYISGCICLPIT